MTWESSAIDGERLQDEFLGDLVLTAELVVETVRLNAAA
jgi:hypothetical protein